MKILGTLASVERGDAGTAIVGDYPQGSTVLQVANVDDLVTAADPPVGRVVIGDLEAANEYVYTLDVGESQISVSPGLVDAVEDGDPVVVAPARTTVTAYVLLPGGGELVTASVVSALTSSDVFAADDYADGTGPMVEMERVGGSYVITDVPGRVSNVNASTLLETEGTGLMSGAGSIVLNGKLVVSGNEEGGEIRLPHATDPFDLVLKDGEILYESQTSDDVPAGIRFGGGFLAIGVTGYIAGHDDPLSTAGVGIGDGHLLLDSHGYIDMSGDTIRIAAKNPHTFPASHVKIEHLLDPVDPHDAATKAYVDANAGGGGSVVEYVTVMLDSGDQSIANGTGSLKVIQWQTTQDSEGLTWDHSAHRFVADADSAGLFEVSANIAWRGATGGTRYLTVCVNGTEVNQARMNPPSSGVFTQHLVSMPIRLDAGDYIDFQVAQSSGSALGLVGNGDYLTKATIKRIGD